MFVVVVSYENNTWMNCRIRSVERFRKKRSFQRAKVLLFREQE